MTNDNRNLLLFRTYFGIDVPDAEEAKISCPWHEDANPSLQLFITKGEWVCYGCGKRGTIADLIEEGTFIDEEEVKEMHRRLLNDAGSLGFLSAVRRISGDTIRRYHLGWNGGRFAIPVRDEQGRCVNIRLYKPGDSSGNKVISYGKGFGGCRWFPFPPAEDLVVVVEGEMDCLLARQTGIPAYTTTGGARSWNSDLNPPLYGKDVILCYDMDKAGRQGVTKAIQALRRCTRRLRDVKLPLLGKGKDFTDWVIQGGTLIDWHRLCEMTPAYITSAAEFDLSTCKALPLWDATRAENAFVPIEVECVVAGKESSPYLVPSRCEVECNRNQKFCSVCPIAGQNSFLIKWQTGEILSLVGINEELKIHKLKMIAGIPPGCKVLRVIAKEFQTIENVALLPAVDPGQEMDTEQKYAYRQAFILGSGITSNARYTMRGLVVPNQRDQTAVIVVVEAEPAEKDLITLIDRSAVEEMRYEPAITNSRSRPPVVGKKVPPGRARAAGNSDDPGVLFHDSVSIRGESLS